MKPASRVLAIFAITALLAGNVYGSDKVHRKMLQTVNPEGTTTPDSTTETQAIPEAVPVTEPQTQSAVTPSDSGPDSWQWWGGGRWNGRIWQRPPSWGGNWNDDRWNVWDGWDMQAQAAGQAAGDAQVASVEGTLGGPVPDVNAIEQVAAETQALPMEAEVAADASP